MFEWYFVVRDRETFIGIFKRSLNNLLSILAQLYIDIPSTLQLFCCHVTSSYDYYQRYLFYDLLFTNIFNNDIEMYWFLFT